MKVRAFAKINLGLKVLGKREDGFHEIETTFVRIGIFDELEFRIRDDGKIRVEVENAEIPLKENLVFRAAWLLQKFSPKKVGVNISLRKKIPLGSGLGGGSADAAAVLLNLPKIWGLKIPPQKIQKIAADLGSDVPFFLIKKVCRAKGRGDILKKISLPKNFPREVLIIVSLQKISTAWAFENLKLKTQNLKQKKLRFENDFEKLVFCEFPEIRQIKKQLEKSGAQIASLSGSGSAVFGLFRKRPSREAIQEFGKFGSVFVTKIRE